MCGNNQQMATKSDFLKVTSLWVPELRQTADKTKAVFILWKTVSDLLKFSILIIHHFFSLSAPF